MKERIIFFDASRIIVIVPVAVNITFKKICFRYFIET